MQGYPVDEPHVEDHKLEKVKKRHGCLTAYLIFLIVFASIAIILYSAYSAGVSFASSLPVLPGWAVLALLLIGILELVCCVALFKWKKWGFWGLCVIGVAAVIINIALGGGASAFSGLVGIAILFIVLNTGDDNKGWPQLD